MLLWLSLLYYYHSYCFYIFYDHRRPNLSLYGLYKTPHPIPRGASSMKLVSKLLGGFLRWELRHGASSCEVQISSSLEDGIRNNGISLGPKRVWKRKIPWNCNVNGQMKERDLSNEMSTLGYATALTHPACSFGFQTFPIFHHLAPTIWSGEVIYFRLLGSKPVPAPSGPRKALAWCLGVKTPSVLVRHICTFVRDGLHWHPAANAPEAHPWWLLGELATNEFQSESNLWTPARKFYQCVFFSKTTPKLQ